jgi:hypothetical protein
MLFASLSLRFFGPARPPPLAAVFIPPFPFGFEQERKSAALRAKLLGSPFAEKKRSPTRGILTSAHPVSDPLGPHKDQ